MPSVEINWLALAVAALINLAIGGVWYSPALLKKQRRAAAGRSGLKSGGLGYGLLFLASLLQAFILVHFVRYAGALTALRGAEAGFWLWLGFTAIAATASGFFEGRSLMGWQRGGGYSLVALIINGALLAAWR